MYKKIIDYVKARYNCSVKTCWIADVKERCGLPMRKAPNRINPNVRTNPCPDRYVEIIRDAFKYFGMI